MPDLIPYALTLLATIAGGWALYKWGSATGNAKAERAEDARQETKTEADTEKGALAEVIRQDAIVAGGDADGMRRNRLSEALRRERDS